VNNNVRIDQYIYVDRSCPIRTDLHPADDFVEIALGEYRFGDNTLRLVFNDLDTLRRFSETIGEAHVKLVQHLRAAARTDPAMSQIDSTR
jgi:hypothetical protein